MPGLNDRPLDDPRTQEALDIIMTVMRQYDLAGGVYVVNDHEMGFAYSWYTTWNAIVEDDPLPEVPGHQTLGWRIRANAQELGKERTKELIEGTGWTIGAMHQFGEQCLQWSRDLLRMLRQAGIQVTLPTRQQRRVPHMVGIRNTKGKG